MSAPSQARETAAVGSLRQLVIAVVAVVAGNVCCGGATTPPQPQLSFPAEPDQTVVSDLGALTVAVRFSPDPPVAGSDAAQLTITDATGNPVSGLDLAVVPWMPAHGHGTSVNPTVTETSPGVFVATPLYLFMPGSWELRMATSGSVDDTARAAFEIP